MVTFGQISIFWGQISIFWGQISIFWGQISIFWGQISTFWEQILIFWGQISIFWGHISTFWCWCWCWCCNSSISEDINIYKGSENTISMSRIFNSSPGGPEVQRTRGAHPVLRQEISDRQNNLGRCKGLERFHRIWTKAAWDNSHGLLSSQWPPEKNQY